jgi:hypothetical protein
VLRTRAGGGIGRIGHRFIGAIIAASGPTVTNSSALGAAPLILSASDTGYDAGARVQWEFAASLTPAKNVDGSYTTPSQSGVTFIDGDSWARMDLALGFATPSGPYSFHFRVLIDNENGLTTVVDQFGQSGTYDAQTWSNDFADTISASSAVWSSATGVNKSQYLTPSNGNLTLTMNNSVNAACGCRATISPTGKRYFETTIVSHGTETGGSILIGITDDTTALGAAVFPRPGGSGGGGGCDWSLKAGSTATLVNRNGGQVAGTSLSTVLTDGDLLGISFDTVANTVKLSHKPSGGTGAWYDVQTITLTSQIPTNWRAYTGGFGRTGAGAPYDAWTTNFGGAAFSRAFDAGYAMYG